MTISFIATEGRSLLYIQGKIGPTRPGPAGTLRVTLCHGSQLGWSGAMVVGCSYTDLGNSMS